MGRNSKQEKYRQIILNLIKTNPGISTTGIYNITNIKLATISELINQLIKEDWVLRADKTDNESGIGRKRVQLIVNPSKTYIIGIEIDTDLFRSVITDLAGKPVYKITEPFTKPVNKETVLAQLVTRIKKLISESKIPRKKISGIGICVPGITLPDKGVSVYASNIPGWENVPLKDVIQKELQIPVIIESSNRVKVFAEKQYNKKAKDAKTMIFVEYTTFGIACGLIINNELYYGSTNSEGEIGHFCINGTDVVCNCGATGCLEAVASSSAVIKKIRACIENGSNSVLKPLVTIHSDNLTFDKIIEAADKNDKLAITILDEAVNQVGTVISMAVNLLNPDLVVFDNKLSRFPDMLGQMKRVITKKSLRYNTQNIQLMTSALDEYIGAAGVAMFWSEKIFKIIL
jgi:predicted NBD/HSP70 family sugar kinase